MRFNLGPRRSTPATPTNDMPHYYRHHLDNQGADVLIAAWQCPTNAPRGANAEWFERNCTLPLENVNFAIEDPAKWTDGAQTDAPTTHRLDTSEIRIAATPSPGYARDPYMVCDIPEGEDATNTFRCNWYTWQLVPGDITVYAWECPEGYDFTAEQANPMADCIGIANGVQFRLRNSDPGHERVTQAGAYRLGAARFGDLEPGDYTLTELTSSAETIVWECFGVNADRTQPAPGTGPELTFSIASGDHILCHRFHVRHSASKADR